MPAVIGSYRERYDGWFCVRFDDTDPETKRPDLEAYDAILEDLEYLGFEPDDVYRASDRLETYYDHARELIEMGGAYTCDLPGEEFSELKTPGSRRRTATRIPKRYSRVRGDDRRRVRERRDGPPGENRHRTQNPPCVTGSPSG